MPMIEEQITESIQTGAPSIKYEQGRDQIASMPDVDAELYQMFLEALKEGQLPPGTDFKTYKDMMMQIGQQQVEPGQGIMQEDRAMAAYGGLMGADGRKQYGIGSWFQENIMDPYKKNVLGQTQEKIDEDSQKRVDSETKNYENPIDTFLKGKRGEDDAGNETRTGGQAKNIIPAIGGVLAGLFTKGTENDTPGLPSDSTAMQIDDLKKSANILNQEQGMAAGLNFLPSVASRKFTPAEMIETYQNAANGGRIGYNEGNAVIDYENNTEYKGWKSLYEVNKDVAAMSPKHKEYENYYMSQQNMKAEGGIMDLGGMEKDYRAEGGFVPIGGKEKADDVPARLSVNEFVFTADAVRSAGGGDIDQGAQVMENMMKHLEQGGQVSEESQGMSGAQEMFETSERLSEVV